MRRMAIALTAALAAIAAASAEAEVRRVVLIGDSITYGVVAGEGGPPYAALLAERLGPAYEVVNAGCGGATSLDWTISRPSPICGGVGVLEEGLYEAQARPHLPADVATVLLGTNDAVGYLEPEPVGVEAYRAALNEIIWNLLLDGVDTVVLMTAPDRRWADPDVAARLGGYRERILAHCGEDPRVVCGPDLHRALDVHAHFEPGNVHPNAAGHHVIADALVDDIRAVAPLRSRGIRSELPSLPSRGPRCVGRSP